MDEKYCILCATPKSPKRLHSAIVNGAAQFVCIGHGMTSPATYDEIVGTFPVTERNYHEARRARIYLNRKDGGATLSRSHISNVFSDGSFGFRGSLKDYKSLVGATKALRKFIDQV